MARKAMDIIRDLGQGVTPIVVGMVLVSNQTLIPVLPPIVHQFGGWAIVIVGVVDLIQKFTK